MTISRDDIEPPTGQTGTHPYVGNGTYAARLAYVQSRLTAELAELTYEDDPVGVLVQALKLVAELIEEYPAMPEELRRKLIDAVGSPFDYRPDFPF